MVDRTTDDAALLALLSTPRRIALLGASPDERRPSNRVFRYLLAAGHHVLPVTPVAPQVAGVPCVPDIAAAAATWGQPPEVVDVFRAPPHLPAVLDEALESGAPWLWLQLGVVHEETIERALGAGLEVVVDRCIKIEAARLQDL
jgi:predicted CoA-binding protein